MPLNPFILHFMIEIPVAVIATFAPTRIPLPGLHPAMLLIIRMWGILSMCFCLVSVLVAPLPSFLPGKRAVGLSLLIYNMIISSLLFTLDTSFVIIPSSDVKVSIFASIFREIILRIGISPERLWSIMHGFCVVALGVWWQSTVELTKRVARGETPR